MIQSIVTDKNLQIKLGIYSIYCCPSCRGNDIKEHYKFCPHCGKEVSISSKTIICSKCGFENLTIEKLHTAETAYIHSQRRQQ